MERDIQDEQLRVRPAIHPGRILKEEFMEALGISQSRLARDTGMPQSRIQKILAGERAITCDTALRLALFFGTTPNYWLNLQNTYELQKAERSGLHQTLLHYVRPFSIADSPASMPEGAF